MHIPAHVPAKDQSRFRNRKGVLSQNVLAACTFDLQFIFVYPGWEGSAADSLVLRTVLDDPDQNFHHTSEGFTFYLFLFLESRVLEGSGSMFSCGNISCKLKLDEIYDCLISNK